MKTDELHLAVSVLRLLSSYIQTHPEALSTKGVTREAATDTNYRDLVLGAVRSGNSDIDLSITPSTNTLADPRTVFSLIPGVLHEKHWLEVGDFPNEKLFASMQSYLTIGTESQLLLGAVLFDFIQFIENLLQDHDINKQLLGEALYRYFYILHKIAKGQENLPEAIRLNPLGLAKIAQTYFLKGAAFTLIDREMMQVVDNKPKLDTELLERMSAFVEYAITSERFFEMPFETKYEAMGGHFISARQQRLHDAEQRLEHSRTASQLVNDRIAVKFLQEDHKLLSMKAEFDAILLEIQTKPTKSTSASTSGKKESGAGKASSSTSAKKEAGSSTSAAREGSRHRESSTSVTRARMNELRNRASQLKEDIAKQEVYVQFIGRLLQELSIEDTNLQAPMQSSVREAALSAGRYGSMFPGAHDSEDRPETSGKSMDPS